jgi:hypothetical protein
MMDRLGAPRDDAEVLPGNTFEHDHGAGYR